jgi:KUP system potassium uptake protein
MDMTDHHRDDLLRHPLRLEATRWRCASRPPASSSSSTSVLRANLLKLFAGGWFPLVIGGAMFTLMLTWKQGRKLMAAKLRDDAIDLKASWRRSSSARRCACPARRCSCRRAGLTPNALLHNLKHNKVLHEHNLFVTVRHHEVPWIGFDKRCEMTPLGHDCWQVTLHFGFKNDPDVPEALKLLEGRGVPLDDMETSYFLSRDIVIPRSAAACRCGARSCSRACTATPRRRPTS